MRKGDRLLTAREVIERVYGRHDLATAKSVHQWSKVGVRVRAGLGLPAACVVRLEGAVQTPRGVMWPESCVDRFRDALQERMDERSTPRVVPGSVPEGEAAAPLGAADKQAIEEQIRASRMRNSTRRTATRRPRRRDHTTCDA